jgi:hypothetical protein
MTTATAELFDAEVLAFAERSTFEAEPLSMPRSLFDFPRRRSRRRRPDLSARVEEDVERWDGLS